MLAYENGCIDYEILQKYTDSWKCETTLPKNELAKISIVIKILNNLLKHWVGLKLSCSSLNRIETAFFKMFSVINPKFHDIKCQSYI